MSVWKEVEKSRERVSNMLFGTNKKYLGDKYKYASLTKTPLVLPMAMTQRFFSSQYLKEDWNLGKLRI